VSERQQYKARFSTIRTVAGITRDIKPLKTKASSGMAPSPRLGANREFDSNVTDESDLQCEKHLDPRIPTFLEIKID
jgi:hypothetical protein